VKTFNQDDETRKRNLIQLNFLRRRFISPGPGSVSTDGVTVKGHPPELSTSAAAISAEGTEIHKKNFPEDSRDLFMLRASSFTSQCRTQFGIRTCVHYGLTFPGRTRAF
jgi:hypothetical protein